MPRSGGGGGAQAQPPILTAKLAGRLATGQVTGIAGFGHVRTWIAFTVSLLALAGLFRHGWPVLRGQHHPAAAEDGA